MVTPDDPHTLLAAIRAALASNPKTAGFAEWLAATDSDLRLVLAYMEVENRPGQSIIAEARRNRRNALIASVANSLPPVSRRARALMILDAVNSRHTPQRVDFAELVKELRKHPIGDRQLESLIPRN
jgi:hypothetical protein